MKPYRVCFECGHEYATPEELVEADFKVLSTQGFLRPDEAERQPADEIGICPNCTHDF